VRFAALLALALCSSCVSFTYERDLAFEPVPADAVAKLRVGESDIGDALAHLGAPLYVWEGVDHAVVMAYGHGATKGWGVRLSRSSVSFNYDDVAERIEGYLLVFGDDDKLRLVRAGLLRDLSETTRRPPALVE
jgi:hypothetical protein